MYTLSCESTADLTLAHYIKRDIPVIAYTYTVDGEVYEDDMRAGKGLAIFYSQLLANKRPTTSQINVERYAEFFRAILQKGDLLHIAFSSGLSASVNNAFAAAEIVKKEFPKRKVYVVDSTCGCVGYGLFVDTLADLRDKGESIDSLHQWAEEHKRNVVHQFYSTTLTYFRRSGRLSGPAALLGNILKLCPIMHTDYDGRIVAYSKVMSESKAIARTLSEIEQLIDGGHNYDGKLWLAHSNYISSATRVEEELAKSYPKADIKVFDIGPVVASHCGPGTLATFFWGKERIK